MKVRDQEKERAKKRPPFVNSTKGRPPKSSSCGLTDAPPAEYIVALEAVWTNGMALQGFLLTDGLEAPARPGEVDRTIRETNLPVPERTMSPGEPMPQP